MKVFVTGATGFVGSAVVQELFQVKFGSIVLNLKRIVRNLHDPK